MSILCVLILWVYIPIFVNQVMLEHYRDAVAEVYQFGPRAAKGEIDLKAIRILEKGKYYEYSSLQQEYVRIYIRNPARNVFYQGQLKQGIVLKGEFEHLFSPSPDMTETFYFYLEKQNEKWRVRTIAVHLADLDLLK